MTTSSGHHSAEERQKNLREASERYLRGEITPSKFEEAIQQYTPSYDTSELPKQGIFKKIFGWLTPSKND